MRYRTRWTTVEDVLVYVIAVTGALAMLFPLYWMFRGGLKPEAEVFAWPPSLLPGRLHFDVWARAWTSGPFTRFMINSLFIATTSMVLSVFINSLAAFGFSKYQFRGSNVLFTVYLATLMIPGQVTMIPLFLVIRELGWINTYQGVIVPGLASGFGVFLMRQYMVSVPTEILESARLDGCKEFGLYWRLMLPLSVPVLVVWSLFAFLGQWNSFLWPLIILNDRNSFTLPIGLQYFQNEFYSVYNQMLAVATISLIPVLVIFLLFQRHIVEGISTTGIKG